MSDFLLKAEHVSIIRKEKRILDNVSLAVDPGEFVTVIGPNGAGKSMLLHVAMGLVKPDSGRVIRKEGLKIGYVPQRFTPAQTLPVTVSRFLGLARKATGKTIEETLEMTGAEDLIRCPLHVLSGGEMQRVLLARALLDSPDLLVLDEPAQNLDIGGELAFYRLLDQVYRGRGCAVLMVSHDLHMVMASTGRVVCLFHHVCCSGAPDVVTKDPKFGALFGQDMTRMMAFYSHAHNHEHKDAHDHDHEH